MTDRRAPVDWIGDTRVIVVVRASDASRYVELAGRLGEIGLDVHEITLTTPGALECIAALRAEQPELLVGAGTVLTAEDAHEALAAGASFIVSPTLDARIVAIAHEAGAMAIPGAMTPTEVHAAVRAGADAVKIFPASIGGPHYIKALRGPMPDVRFVPTGGISTKTAPDYLAAGAHAVCLGTSFLGSASLEEGRFEVPLRQAEELIAALGQRSKARKRRKSDAR